MCRVLRSPESDAVDSASLRIVRTELGVITKRIYLRGEKITRGSNQPFYRALSFSSRDKGSPARNEPAVEVGVKLFATRARQK